MCMKLHSVQTTGLGLKIQPIISTEFHFLGVFVNISGRFRNSERGVQPLAREAHTKFFGVSMPTSGQNIFLPTYIPVATDW